MINLIKKDQIAARKSGDIIARSALTAVINDCTEVGFNAKEATNDKVIAVIRKHLKGMNETAGLLEQKDVRLNDVLGQMRVLTKYLPKALTDEEIKSIIIEARKHGEPNIGQLMGLVKAEAAKQEKLFDGGQVQLVIKSL